MAAVDLGLDEPEVIAPAAAVDVVAGHLRELGIVAVLGPSGSGKTTVSRAAVAVAGLEACAGGGLPALRHRPGLALARAVRVPLPSCVDDAATLTVAVLAERVLLLDDAHRSDEHSLLVVAAAGSRIRAVVAVDSGDDDCDHVVDVVQPRCQVEVEPLDVAALTAVVCGVNPDLDDATVTGIVAAARGNPGAAVELALGNGARARRSLAARATRLTTAGRTALVVLGLRGRPTSVRLLGRGADELLGSGLAEVVGQQGTAGAMVAFASASTYALAATLASAADLARLHRYLADSTDDLAERADHLAAAGEDDLAASAAVAAAAASGTDAARVRHLRFAAEHATGERARRLWRDTAEAAAQSGDRETERLARRRAVAGSLTARELEVMGLVAEGLATAAIARRLQISVETVDTHVQAAVQKLGARNRTEASVLMKAGHR